MPLVRVKQQKHCFSTLPYVETIYKDHVVGINMFIYHLFAMIVTIPFRVMCCWTCYASVKSRVAGYTSAIELFTLLTDDENALEQDHWAQLTHQHTKKKGIACHCFHLIIDIARCVLMFFLYSWYVGPAINVPKKSSNHFLGLSSRGTVLM